MIRTKSRTTRRRHDRVHTAERAAPATVTAPTVNATGDPRDRHADIGMRPYEAAYSISRGYTADRAIVLP
jgi:hypothetical protein